LPTSPARAEHPENSRNDSGRRAARGFVFGVTLFVVLAALVVSIALVVYTAYLHDLWNGGFALIFAVLSAQVALNWLLWRDDEEE
jgi:hypothetical protein